MRDPKGLALFEEIRKKTEQRSLKWQPTADPESYMATMLGKYILTLRPFTGEWGAPDDDIPSIYVADAQGRRILIISTEVDGINVRDLREFAEIARRVAINADEKIDELLKGLQELPGDDVPY
jgi:hypothetical protein